MPKSRKAYKKKTMPAEMLFEPAVGSPERLLQSLNDEQHKAVTWGEGPLLILAGAGTGKTRVLTHRLAWLIAEKRARPEEILALTFTDKAAREMEARVDVLVPYGYVDAFIGTFHAFGDSIIRDHALEMGLPLDHQLLTEAEQVLFLMEHLFEVPLQVLKPTTQAEDVARSLAKTFSRAKDEDISPEEYAHYAERLTAEADQKPGDPLLQDAALRQTDIAAAYAVYQRLMRETGRIDFGDQVWLPLKFLREHPAALARYRDRFRYILIDEFQDTNHTQFELVRLLAGDRANLTVVGDDDQSIYKFRGAAISNILSFNELYPKAEQVVLTRNYRSNQPILDCAYRLIQNNNPDRLEVKLGKKKRLESALEPGGDGAPVSVPFDVLDHEADWVAGEIARRVKEKKLRYSDAAILLRNNGDADPFLRALNMLSIPYHFSGSRGLYDKPGIRSLLAFMKSVTDWFDSMSLYSLAASSFYRVPDYDLMVLASEARRRHVPLRDVMEKRAGLESIRLSDPAEASIARLLEDLHRYLKLSREATSGQVLYQFLVDTGHLKQLASRKTAAAEEALSHIAAFFDVVRHFSRAASQDRLSEFAQHLELLRGAGDNPATGEEDFFETDAVNVLTVHKAKGLEFQTVFLAVLVDQKFPGRRRRDAYELPDALLSIREKGLTAGDPHLQEERRLFYVGMTRAKQELFLTHSADLGGKRLRKVSPFVLEALDLPKTTAPALKKSGRLQSIERAAPPPAGGTAPALRASSGEVPILSHRQVDDYQTCPLKYKYVNILRIPILSHHAIVYGNALHQAVGAMLRAKMDGKPFTFEDATASFHGAWRSEGFLHRDHEERRYEEGLATLKRFYDAEAASPLKPASVEKEFSFKKDGLVMKGRFDRVDGEGAEAMIRDYKSSVVDDQKDADKKARDNLQLTLYALAHKEQTGTLPKQVELYFLESGMTGVAVKNDEDIKEAWALVRETAEGIREGKFDPTPDYFRACRFCAYRDICIDAATG